MTFFESTTRPTSHELIHVTLLGGRDGNGGFPSDTWTWNGKDWWSSCQKR